MQDLFFKLRKNFNGESFQTDKNGTIFIAPHLVIHTTQKFAFPTKQGVP